MGKLIIAPNVLFYINLSKTVTFWKGNKGILNWSRPLGKLVKQNEIWMLKIFVDKLEFFEHLWIWQEYFSSVFFIFFLHRKGQKKGCKWNLATNQLQFFTVWHDTYWNKVVTHWELERNKHGNLTKIQRNKRHRLNWTCNPNGKRQRKFRNSIKTLKESKVVEKIN